MMHPTDTNRPKTHKIAKPQLASVGSRPFCRARSPQIRSISSSEPSAISPDPRTRTLRIPRSRSLPHQPRRADKPNWTLLNSLTPAENRSAVKLIDGGDLSDILTEYEFRARTNNQQVDDIRFRPDFFMQFEVS